MTNDLRSFLIGLFWVVLSVACGIGGALIGGWR